MARSVEDIEKNILTIKSLQSELSDLNSTAPTAIWRLWVYIVAVVMQTLEKLWDGYKKEVSDIAERAVFGNTRWYVHIAKQWQNGDVLVWDEDEYIYKYATEDEDLQLVKFAAIRANAGGVVVIKVAKANVTTGDPEALSSGEKISFTAYMNDLKIAGTPLTVISDVGDLLKLDLDVHYDAIVDKTALQTAVESAIEGYIQGLPFDGVFRTTHMVDAIQAVEGVVDVKVNTAEAKYSTLPYSAIDLEYVSNAGYLEIDPAFPLSTEITYVGKVI